MRRMWRLAFLLALITTACRIEANLDLVINEDGSGSYTAEVGFDEEIQQAFATFGDPEELLGALDFGVPGAEATERVEGDMTYSVVTSDFEDATELTQTIQNNVDGNPFEEFEIVVDDDGATVDAAIEIPEALSSALNEAPAAADQLDASITVNITMPGRIVSSNADQTIGDNQLVWDIAFTETVVVIQAESTFAEEGFPFWIIFLLILVAGAVLAWWLWSRRQQEAAVARVEAAGDDAV